MPVHDDGENVGGKPETEPSIQVPSQPSGNQNPPPPPASNNPGHNENETGKFEKDIRTGEYWLVGVGIVGLFVNIVIAHIYLGQLGEMRLATEAATKAANLAADSFEINDGNFQRAMNQTIRQTSAQLESAQAAQDAVKSAQNQMRLDQRAWVGVQGTSDIHGFTETEPWGITVVFFNSGRSPARNVRTSAKYITSPIAISGPSLAQVALLNFRPAQSIAPQGFYRQVFGVTPGAEAATLEQVSGQQVLISQYPQIKNKQLFLYYYGLLKYDDSFNKPHETQFCILLANPDTKEAGMCDSFNDLN